MNFLNKSQNSKGCMLLKIDLEKAFDKIKWFFVHDILKYFKIFLRNSTLIMKWITISTISVLVNGSKTVFCSPSRGIRQGNPFPLYVLILCMEMLSNFYKLRNGYWPMGPYKNPSYFPYYLIYSMQMILLL